MRTPLATLQAFAALGALSVIIAAAGFFAPGALAFGLGAALALGGAFVVVDLTFAAPIDDLISSGRLDLAGPPGPDVVTRLRQRVAAELAAERRRAETLAEQRAQESLADMESEAESARRRAVAGFASALKALAEGDLTARIATPELKRDFEAAVALYGKTVFAFTSSTAAISSSVREIVAEADALAEEAATAMGPLSAAREAIVKAAQAAEAREKELDRASEAEIRERAAADRLRALVDEGAASLEQVAAERKRVNAIVERVAEVVFQMHLVAVNAGVEAARSGEAGKGFAVVAQELRTLSQRSTEATAELTRAFAGMGLDSAKRAAALREVLEEAPPAPLPETVKPAKAARAAMKAVENALKAAAELVARTDAASGHVGEASRALDGLVAKLAALASHFRLPGPEVFAQVASMQRAAPAHPEPLPPEPLEPLEPLDNEPLPTVTRLPQLRRLKVG